MKSYLDENVDAVNVRLTEEDMAALDGLASMGVCDRYPPAMASAAGR